jgi:glycosyltransferase involved in cell wall biosynthesis
MVNVVSVISELKFGGGENRLLNFARAIDRQRFRHTVATVFAPNPKDAQHCGSLRSTFERAGIDVVELQIPHPGASDTTGLWKAASTAKTLATAAGRIRQLLVDRKADVVDAHLETALYTAVPAAASVGVPAAVTMYSELDLWKRQEEGSYRSAIFAPLRRFNLGLCGALITDSAARAEDFRRYLGRRAPALHVIPNGVQLEPRLRPRDEILEHFGIPKDTQSVIAGQVAGLVPYKGQHLLVEAVARLVCAGHDVRVLLVGEERLGPAYPRELRERAARLGIADRLHMSRYAGNIAEPWSLIDIHVHGSTIDSLPNAIIEGMSLGKPAILSAVGAVPDHVDDGRTGLLVPPDDADALSAALSRLLDDRGFAKRLGEGARRRYLERFTPGATARQMERCLVGLLRGTAAIAGAGR